MTHTSQQFGFFVESVAGNGRGSEPTGTHAEFSWLALPSPGLAQLLVSAEPPRLLTDESHEHHDRLAVCETIRHAYKPYLMLLAPQHLELRVNGLPASPVCILRTKDQVQVATNYILHVSSWIRPYRGAADQADVGQNCLVCRTPILGVQTVYRCPHCELALHAGGPDRPEDDRLECAFTTTDCPRCRLPLIREEGFSYVPEA